MYYCPFLRVCCQAAKKELKLWVKNLLHKLISIRNGPVKSTETRKGRKHDKTILLQKGRGKERLEDNSTSVAYSGNRSRVVL